MPKDVLNTSSTKEIKEKHTRRIHLTAICCVQNHESTHPWRQRTLDGSNEHKWQKMLKQTPAQNQRKKTRQIPTHSSFCPEETINRDSNFWDHRDELQWWWWNRGRRHRVRAACRRWWWRGNTPRVNRSQGWIWDITTTLVIMNAIDVRCLSLLQDTLTKTLSDTYQNHYAFSHIFRSPPQKFLQLNPPHTQKSQLTFCVKRRTLVKFISFRNVLHNFLFDLQHRLKDTA